MGCLYDSGHFLLAGGKGLDSFQQGLECFLLFAGRSDVVIIDDPLSAPVFHRKKSRNLPGGRKGQKPDIVGTCLEGISLIVMDNFRIHYQRSDVFVKSGLRSF